MEIIDNVEYWHTEDVALALGVSPGRVRQILLLGNLAGRRVGDRYRGYWLILPEQVEIYQQTRRKPGAPRGPRK